MTKSAFGFDAPEDSPGFLLWQTTVVWQRLIRKALEPFHVSHPEFVILAVLLWFEENEQKPIQTMLVRKTKLDKMTVSKVLKKLVDDGFVKREESISDTRAKCVCLTNKARALIKKLIPIVEKTDQDYFSIMGSNDQQSFKKFLCSLVEE